MSITISSLKGDFILHCPCCSNDNFFILPMSGYKGEIFLKTLCQKCHEHYFFQSNQNLNNFFKKRLVNYCLDTKEIINFQLEWDDWFSWKKKHLNTRNPKKTLISKYSYLILFFMLVFSTVFFILDRWHLLDPFIENPSIRQQHIDEYSNILLEIPCLPSIMKVKIKTVPILYTQEKPVHKNFIQFGEAGIYWGQEQIKIHRSNFWFFGLPKKSQLINTLLHELRHRINPKMGHNKLFFELVDADMKCTLKNFNELVKK